ncbi:hypothetical protein PVK06_049961 [Gossypium arboreum]|uniref:Uncharacterized protein n=1 Tax=Gossypium arboreum TaxID=29729 RepID=A0ABR0M9H4_GOSAR|nr:hypothetical protein PVK06_049961 [Gossypium arboreum]
MPGNEADATTDTEKDKDLISIDAGLIFIDQSAPASQCLLGPIVHVAGPAALTYSNPETKRVVPVPYLSRSLFLVSVKDPVDGKESMFKSYYRVRAAFCGRFNYGKEIEVTSTGCSRPDSRATPDAGSHEKDGTVRPLSSAFCRETPRGLLLLLGLDFFAMIFPVVHIRTIAVSFLFVVLRSCTTTLTAQAWAGPTSIPRGAV